MSPLFETIRIQNRQAVNLDLHNERMNRSRRELFGITRPLDLRTIIQIPKELNNDIHRCKVIYTAEIVDIVFSPYTPKIIRSLAFADGTGINYRYKWTNREALESLVRKSSADDVIIIQQDCLTDASFANLIFFDGHQWLTPSTPLLHGVMRTKLLREGKITETLLKTKDLKKMKSVKLINAMLDFEHTHEIPIKRII